MTVFEMLALRYEFNEIVHKFQLPGDRKDGTLENLEYFKRYGHKKNRFRDNFDRALEIAKSILEESNGGTRVRHKH